MTSLSDDNESTVINAVTDDFFLDLFPVYQMILLFGFLTAVAVSIAGISYYDSSLRVITNDQDPMSVIGEGFSSDKGHNHLALIKGILHNIHTLFSAVGLCVDRFYRHMVFL